MKYEPSPRPIDCGGISADVNYVDAFTRADDPMHDGAHIHSFCEVYLNLSGDVSFVVEDSVYPVVRRFRGSPGRAALCRSRERSRACG